MRRIFTTEQAALDGVTPAALRWGERTGRWVRAGRGVYAEGPDPVSRPEREVALVVRAGGVARGGLAGWLHGLDSVSPDGRPMRRDVLDPVRVVIVQGVRCADGLQTLIDLAPVVDDDVSEQALESALRKRLTTVAELEAVPRRVPALRPPDRQVRVEDGEGRCIARVDLAWPALGLFVELDGQHHADQPVHDARRQTAVVAATGWLCARFTWSEVTRVPASTARRLAALADQARARPVIHYADPARSGVV